MKIRDKLLFIAILPLVLALVVGSIQYHNANAIQQHTEKARLADELYKMMASLTQLTTEYHMFYEERAREQWLRLHAGMGKKLEEVTPLFASPNEQEILANARRSHKTLSYLFEQYGPHRPHQNDASWRKYAERITSRILQEQELFMPELERLHGINHVAALTLGHRQSRLFGIFLIGLALTIPVSVALVFRSFSRPLQEVQKGMQAFAAGEQGYRIRATAKDEIGEVARAFDQMAEQRTRALLARQEAEQMLVHQSRLAAMGEMIGAIAHQWRQPLNTVNAIIQDIKDAHSYQELDQAYLDRSVEDAMRQIRFMSKTIDDFRNFFRPDKEKKPFDIKLAAGEVLIMLSSQLLARSISYRLTCHEHGQVFENFTTPVLACEGTVVMGHENELKQVFLNLINNAGEAIEERRASGGMPPEEKALIAIDFSRSEGRVMARVTDNGGGIVPEIMARIFEPYFSTKEQGKGTGIGLYMAKMIVEKNMQGRLTAKNVGNGAEFCLELECAHG